MDPVGPWAYASYNRLAGVQASTGTGDLHHPHHGASGAPPTTTAQILPGSFLSPSQVAYESVFSPLFHAGAKPTAHYVTQVTQHHRAQALAQAQAAAVSATKQTTEDNDYHQTPQTFFEQSTSSAAAAAAAAAWQQTSPFGILPHESVVSTTGTTKSTYENFNAHFANINHLNTQLEAVKTAAAAANRAQSPQVSSTASSKTTANFFQVPSTFAVTETSNANKTFSSTNSSNMQQSCIVSSPSNTPITKEYRVPPVAGTTSRSTFLPSQNSQRSVEKTYQPSPKASPVGATPQIQTKAQTKIYTDRNSEESQSQSSPISFSIMDAPGRLNYSGSNSSGKRPPQFQHANYRHYSQQNTNTEQDFQRTKSNSEYSNTNGPDCSVVVPRRPSPLQAHSQASPLGHAPSPAYPMYNSPMSSLSSPQQSSSNQVTPPSPLDVSVPRPNSQTGNIAYPSVITRAINSDKTFPERYERSQQQQPTTPNNQNCWDERQNQSRKFHNHNTSQSNYSTNSIDINRNDQQQQQRVNLSSLTDRQQTYFDSNQVPLQDLSSCRGDPMSIVKNLQQQQQSCQVPSTTQIEIKQEVKLPTKRRKSSEKPVITPVVNDGRIPPPAHTSGTIPQQQNGAYIDFDRWNLPPPASKLFATQTLHQQHQGLMVPHPHGHHPPPPLPYFPPFHLPPHPTEFSSSVDLPPASLYVDQTTANQYQHPQQQQPQPTSAPQPAEDQPKVVVPNIEEELNFLSETPPTPPNATNNSLSSRKPVVPINKIINKKPNDTNNGPGSGFMSSYLKFLQGERDSSPPPVNRNNRNKQTTWARPKLNQNENDVKPEVNGVVQQHQPIPPPVIHPPIITTRLSQGDPQDDPRYFPLPKERKRNSFDDSDDGLSSDDDFFSNTKHNQIKLNQSKDKQTRKRKIQPSTERKRPKKTNADKEKRIKNNHDNSIENIPRRESSKRAAKEKSNLQNLIKNDEDVEEPLEFQDSDSDPAWTPKAKDDNDELPIVIKKGRKGRQSSLKKRRNLITAAAQGAGIQEIDGYSSDSFSKKPRNNKKQSGPPTLEDNIAAAIPNNNAFSANEDNPFKPGEFIILKSELNQEYPSLWRVDGKMLLQKYEPFEQEGAMFYKNISTYTSWTPESKKQYVAVPVRYKSQTQTETVVEFLRHDMMVVDQEIQQRSIKENEHYQDNFEVYIQTLISQALDSNFLTEIFQEKDEYFLSNVKTIDDITESRKKKLMSLLRWPPQVQAAVCTWPCFNVIWDLNCADVHLKKCSACGKQDVSVRVLMYGQPYNSTTLDGCPPDPKAMNEKNFLMCRVCATRVELSNKVTHQKYLMYIECAKRVSEKRTTDPNKDTTCILNELLADESWLNQLFYEVRTVWAEIDCIEHSIKLRNNSAHFGH